MIKLLGYSLTILGFAGFFFFINYRGTVIPIKELWFVLSILLVTLGTFLMARNRFQKHTKGDSNKAQLLQNNKLKHIGEKIKITLDNCEIRCRSYQQEIINESWPSQREMLDALYDNNRSYREEEVQQAYIFYYKKYGETTFKFISQPVAQSADTLKRYIDNQDGVILYIDKKDPTNYFFDLPFI